MPADEALVEVDEGKAPGARDFTVTTATTNWEMDQRDIMVTTFTLGADVP